MNGGVSVNPQAVVQALHQTYGQTVGQLHQRVAELLAANEALAAERDRLREAFDRASAPAEAIQGVFRQEGYPDQPVTLTDITDTVAPDHGQPAALHVPKGFQGDPRWPSSEDHGTNLAERFPPD